jgi:hypothetical protein
VNKQSRKRVNEQSREVRILGLKTGSDWKQTRRGSVPEESVRGGGLRHTPHGRLYEACSGMGVCRQSSEARSTQQCYRNQ